MRPPSVRRWHPILEQGSLVELGTTTLHVDGWSTKLRGLRRWFLSRSGRPVFLLVDERVRGARINAALDALRGEHVYLVVKKHDRLPATTPAPVRKLMADRYRSDPLAFSEKLVAMRDRAMGRCSQIKEELAAVTARDRRAKRIALVRATLRGLERCDCADVDVDALEALLVVIVGSEYGGIPLPEKARFAAGDDAGAIARRIAVRMPRKMPKERPRPKPDPRALLHRLAKDTQVSGPHDPRRLLRAIDDAGVRGCAKKFLTPKVPNAVTLNVVVDAAGRVISARLSPELQKMEVCMRDVLKTVEVRRAAGITRVSYQLRYAVPKRPDPRPTGPSTITGTGDFSSGYDR